MNNRNEITGWYDVESDEWIVIINENNYRVRYESSEKIKNTLSINNNDIIIPKSAELWFIGFDYAMEIEGRKIHFVFDGEKFDIAIQGRYVRSQKNYIPLKGLFLFAFIMLLLMIIEIFLIINDLLNIPLFILMLVCAFANLKFRDDLIKKAKEQGFFQEI